MHDASNITLREADSINLTSEFHKICVAAITLTDGEVSQLLLQKFQCLGEKRGRLWVQTRHSRIRGYFPDNLESAQVSGSCYVADWIWANATPTYIIYEPRSVEEKHWVCSLPPGVSAFLKPLASLSLPVLQ